MPTYNNLPATSVYFKGSLYDRMVEDLRLSGKAKRTVYGYVRAIRKLAEFCQTTPDKIVEEQRRQFLLRDCGSELKLMALTNERGNVIWRIGVACVPSERGPP